MVKVRIRRCRNCETYTLHERCACGRETEAARPLKYGDAHGRL